MIIIKIIKEKKKTNVFLKPKKVESSTLLKPVSEKIEWRNHCPAKLEPEDSNNQNIGEVYNQKNRADLELKGWSKKAPNKPKKHQWEKSTLNIASPQKQKAISSLQKALSLLLQFLLSYKLAPKSLKLQLATQGVKTQKTRKSPQHSLPKL